MGKSWVPQHVSSELAEAMLFKSYSSDFQGKANKIVQEDKAQIKVGAGLPVWPSP